MCVLVWLCQCPNCVPDCRKASQDPRGYTGDGTECVQLLHLDQADTVRPLSCEDDGRRRREGPAACCLPAGDGDSTGNLRGLLPRLLPHLCFEVVGTVLNVEHGGASEWGRKGRGGEGEGRAGQGRGEEERGGEGKGLSCLTGLYVGPVELVDVEGIEGRRDWIGKKCALSSV